MVTEKNTRITYSASITDIKECNESFDYGVLRIAYHGRNRNGQSISREVFERCANTAYNKPVVAHYIREEDEIGGHDAEIIKCNNRMRLVNITHPVGVVPESARVFWDWVTEDDGSEREYLCAEVLLWKRQEAYSKIRENGITAESMEINIKSGHHDGGVYVIDDFEFLAFCLLGNCEPCFESASLTLFSDSQFQKDVEQMLAEVPSADFKLKEVRNKVVNEKLVLMGEYGLKLEDLDFELDEFSLDELRGKFAELSAQPAGEVVEPEVFEEATEELPEAEAEPAEDVDSFAEAEEIDERSDREEFALTVNQLQEELHRAISVVKTEGEYAWPRYCVVDCDMERSRVICWDTGIDGCDWVLVALPYTMNGDAVEIKFDESLRVKVVYEDFDGESDKDNAPAEFVARRINDSVEYARNAAMATANETIGELNAQIESLSEFKANVEAERRTAAERNVFAAFEDLTGIEEFEALRDNCAELSIEALEEKCFAIRGRHGTPATFSKKSEGIPALPAGSIYDSEPEPYGGLFKKYGRK